MSITSIIESLRKGGSTSECMLWSDPSLGVTLSRENMQLLCECLQANGKVHTLSLSGNTLEGAAAEVLADFLNQATSLRVVDLSFCGLDSEDLAKIVAAVTQNTRLESVLLNASYNNIRIAGALSVADLLAQTPPTNPLKHLVLRYNPLQTDGVAALLRKARNVESIDCSYATLNPALDPVFDALRHTGFKTVRLCGLDLPAADAEAIYDCLPSGCTLLLDESAPRLSTSPVAPTPIGQDVEELLWKEELALLQTAKGRPRSLRGPSSTPEDKNQRTLLVESSPTASSPPPAAASPLTRSYGRETSQPGHRSSVLSSSSSTHRSSHTNTNETIEDSRQTRQHSVEQHQVGSSLASRPTSSRQSTPQPLEVPAEPSQSRDPMLRSLSLALNVLHDNHAAVLLERDALRRDLEREVDRRRCAEAELQRLRRENELLRAGVGVVQTPRAPTHTQQPSTSADQSRNPNAQIQHNSVGHPHSHSGHHVQREPSPQPRTRGTHRSVSPRVGRSGSVNMKQHKETPGSTGPSTGEGKGKAAKQTPTKNSSQRNASCSNPCRGEASRMHTLAATVLARNSTKRRYIIARNN
ncbi:hypothetical protein DIPPA_64125 [Diplonema papillatum]|nr:hypothetical protein DIPPA_64125 [Diplonema papillatum]